MRIQDPMASRLTLRQLRFVSSVLAGESLGAAYIQAYQGRANKTTARTEGWRLARKHPFITPLIEREKARQIICGGDETKRIQELILELLICELDTAKASGRASHVLRVLRLLGNHVSVQAFSKSRDFVSDSGGTWNESLDDAIRGFEIQAQAFFEG